MSEINEIDKIKEIAQDFYYFFENIYMKEYEKKYIEENYLKATGLGMTFYLPKSFLKKNKKNKKNKEK